VIGVVLALVGEGPTIPDFGRGSDCVRGRGQFCLDWVVDNFGDQLLPRLIEHIELTAIAVSIGFVIAFTAALLAHRYHWVKTPFTAFSAFVYTIPSIALFQLLVAVPGLGLSWTSAEIALVGYTLLILFRNILTGLQEVPRDAIDAAEGMGFTQRQILWRVELPLALPAIMAGLRIATVTTISLATIAAYIGVGGIGQPIFDGIQRGFKTQFVAAGILAVTLALVADGLLVLAQRALAPWVRYGR
jgi:osmoprotectant transport system permease protein